MIRSVLLKTKRYSRLFWFACCALILDSLLLGYVLHNNSSTLSDAQPFRGSEGYISADLWIDKITFNPIKAEFYNASGDVLKTIYFGNDSVNMVSDRTTYLLFMDDQNNNVNEKLTNSRTSTFFKGNFQSTAMSNLTTI